MGVEMCVQLCAIGSQLDIRAMSIKTYIDRTPCLSNTDDVMLSATSSIDSPNCVGWPPLHLASAIALVVGDDACVVHIGLY